MARNDAKDALAVIPWYWRDWRASTARAVLLSDPPALMAYRELLDAMWGEKDCSLPSDDASLAALAGLPLKTWKRVREKVLRFFTPNGANGLTHPRSQHEYAKAVAYREGCRTGGVNRAKSIPAQRRKLLAKQAADARWASKEQASTKDTDACRMLADACTPSPTPGSPQKEIPGGGADARPPAPTGAAVAPPEPEPYRLPDSDRDLAIAQRDAENERLARKGLPLRPDLRHHFGLPPMNGKVKS